MNAPARVVLATRSEHKAKEVREIIDPISGLELVTPGELALAVDPAEDAIEGFATFEENALAKAQYFAARTGLPALADDSGIVVDALDGGPGVRTKRLAARPGLSGLALDQANNARLLELLEDVPQEARTAHYVCAAALAFPDGRSPVVVRGTCGGRILDGPRGTGGFGYDPLFLLPELDLTFAEMPAYEKHQISHRGRAFRAIAPHLARVGAEMREPGIR